ncbi:MULTISPECIES: MbtH family protein [Pseudoalteromonas]|uniref:Antibiotic synthesis protein MbtH n=2 Tax=Pseudoalteromonas TaxID=53246 RepID=A0A0F4QDC5_9GAMM|nr:MULTISPECIES: MbtH family protein [Pseudoalteromonas]KJZ05696.1 antibiotic synthesis protein MbtH [Pseudoalteromonas rubra]MCF2908653.1 MbtH family protein [Pseudoalteromonas sp. DL2-H2.2]MCG7537006.1 MbtH family protein [Pseudoalteromonas sp. OOF1S-7]QTL36263.1 MbtH family protein [Pseudoalteromonas viridis]RZM84492.1 MbtH family protein [Pseudoalteromonas rubra]
MSFDNDNGTFKVLVNHEEQYSLWPSYKSVPGGWQDVGVEGDKETCLAYINTHWTDMRPLSLRQAMDQ